MTREEVTMNKEKHWSRFADDFEKRVYYVAGKETIEEIQATLASCKLTGQVLELGCGNGTYSPVLAVNADMLYVTDISEQMVKRCRKCLNDIKNTVIEQQDCTFLSYPDNSFDAIVMVNLLHIIANPAKALKESYRVLKPGGKLVVISFSTAGMTFIDKIKMAYRYFKVYGKPPSSSRRLTINSTGAMIKSENFMVDKIRLLGSEVKAVYACALSNKV